MTNHHHYFLLLVVAMLVIVPAVISGPISVKPDISIDVSRNATSGKTIDKLDLQPTFWENFFKGFIDALPEEPAASETSDSPECCSGVEERFDDLTNQLIELQDKVNEMETRQNAPCQQVTIQSGSCQSACEARGLKCAAAHYKRVAIDRGLVYDTSTIVYADLRSCSDTFYMPADPDLLDESQCSCC